MALLVEVSGDGGANWAYFGQPHLTTPAARRCTVSYDVSSYVADNTQIRFYRSGSGSHDVYLDDVHIDYETSVAYRSTTRRFCTAVTL